MRSSVVAVFACALACASPYQKARPCSAQDVAPVSSELSDDAKMRAVLSHTLALRIGTIDHAWAHNTLASILEEAKCFARSKGISYPLLCEDIVRSLISLVERTNAPPKKVKEQWLLAGVVAEKVELSRNAFS